MHCIRPRALRASIVAVIALAAAASTADAQQVAAPTGAARRPLTIADYARWRTIDAAQLSGDGKWVAYGMRLTNVAATDTKPVLHIVNLETNQDIAVTDGSNPAFSPDSRWVLYQVDPPAPRNGRGGRGANGSPATAPAAPPAGTTPAPNPATPDTAAEHRSADSAAAARRRFELRELATGKVESWQDVQSGAFSPTGTHLLLRRRPVTIGGTGATPGGAPGAGAGGGRGGGSGAPDGKGNDALLHDLTTGHSLFLGSVEDAVFSRSGDLLAYTVGAAIRDGNGLFVIDLKTGTTHVLDNDAMIYSHPTFTDDGRGLAILKAKDLPKFREHAVLLEAFPDVRAAFSSDPEPARPVILEPAKVTDFPHGFVLSDRAALSWSDDNHRVFVSMMPQTAAADTSRHKNADSVADVDVWRAQDERVQSYQMARAEADRDFGFREAFDVTTPKFIRLADSTMKELEVAPDGRWAVGRDIRGYISDYEPPRADIYRVNTATGERTLMLKSELIGQHVVGISPDGKHFLYWKDNKYQDYLLDSATTRTLATVSTPSFIDTEFDHPGPKPAFGVAGYAKDGTGVIVEHRYDLWFLPYDGSSPRVLTEGVGSRQEIKFLPVRLQPIDPAAPRAERDTRTFDLSQPLTLSAYGEWTKKDGFYRLADGKLTPLVFDDASFSTPVKAAHADRYLFTRQTFVEYPDLRIAGPGLADSRKITDANPQQAEFLWGHRVLFDYRIKDGTHLQGILALPDDYQPGQRRPMIVSFYEKNSQNMHRYTAPSYLTGMGSLPMEAVSRGYITMFADVHFHTGSSHSDMLEAVEAATRKVIELGYADPKHIGLNGHSYGGEGAGFIATRSRMFAAVGVGAGVSDLYSDFSQSWGWSYQITAGASGENGLDYYLYGQGRWGFSPWDKPDVYHFESSLTHAPEATAAILIMHGTADPTVSFMEGLKFYTALRYNKKDATMLAYLNEGHGLRGLANRRDLTIRYFQFMDHYLKGAPAPKWMTEGVPYLVKDATTEAKSLIP